MIPILYEASERAFDTNGIGRLRDCISCIVTEERNGKYECELQYPITGKWYKQIVDGMYVSVIHDDTKTRQPFEIYKRSAPLDGVVTFYARHISYMANNIILNPFEASSASSAMSGIESNAINANPFTMWTDKTTSGNFKLEKPSSIRGILGGSRGSILDVYGGEYEFDKFTIKLYAHRGIDTDVTIRYGKNLTDLEQTVDNGTAYDSVVPFWFKDGVLVVPDEKIIGTTKNRPVTMDFTADFESQPTKTQLKNRATAFLNANKPWVPKENIKVDFIQLWQTEDYKDVAALQRVNMCDRVNVYYPALGVTAEKIKVIKTVYNVLTEQYDEMELGEARSTFAQTILKQTEEQMEAIRAAMVTSSMMDAAIEHATELITGGLGGHVVFTLNADGKPEEILIMDTDNVLTAVNVWRFNKGGLGHSHNGYSGPFSDVALTADGRINASMITTGTMSANRILGGTLQLGGVNNGNGTLVIKDANGITIITGDNTGIAITKGSLNLGNGNFVATNNGTLSLTGNGLIETVSGAYKTELKGGRLVCYYNGAQLGILSTVNASDKKYLSLRCSSGADALSFGIDATGYIFINNGGNPNGHTQRIQFVGDIYAGSEFVLSNRLYLDSDKNSFIRRIGYSGGTNVVHLEPKAQVGSSTFVGGTTLTVGGSIYAYGAVTENSDERKKNIDHDDWKELADNFIQSLDCIKYQWKEGDDKQHHIGLGAQRTEKALAEAGLDVALVQHVDDIYGVNYSELAPMMIPAIQKDRKRIEELESRVDELESRIARLEALLLKEE